MNDKQYLIKSWASLWLLFLASFTLRVVLLSKGPFHHDCLELTLQAEKTIQTHHLHPYIWFGYNLTVIWGALFIFVSRLFGQGDPVQAINLMSAFFGAASIPAFYSFLQKILGQKTALLSSFLLSIFPIFLALSTFGTSQTPATFFLFWGLSCLANYKNTLRKKDLLWASVFWGLMGGCRTQDLFIMSIPLAFFYFLPVKCKHASTARHLGASIGLFFLSILVATVVTLLWHLPTILSEGFRNYFQMFNAFQSAAYHGGTEKITLLTRGLETSKNIFAKEFSPLGLTLASAGLVLLGIKKRPFFLFLFLWFVCTFMVYGNIFTTTTRYLLLSSFPLLIAAGYLLSALWNLRKWVFRLPAALCLLLLPFIFLHDVFPVLWARHRSALTPDFARWVASMTEPQSVIIANDEFLFISHYAKRKIYLWPVNVDRPPKDFKKFAQWLNTQLDQKQPVYLIGATNPKRSGNKALNKFLETNYSFVVIGINYLEDWHHATTYRKISQVPLLKISPLNP